MKKKRNFCLCNLWLQEKVEIVYYVTNGKTFNKNTRCSRNEHNEKFNSWPVTKSSELVQQQVWLPCNLDNS